MDTGLMVTVSYWLAHAWLNDFAYKTEITALPFLVTILFAVIVALLIVSSRTLRAALVNPVESLRNE